MPSHEVFANPTVKQVLFQIQFPNLFFIEGKIPEIQLKIIDHFPNSQLLHTQSIIFGNIQSTGFQPGLAVPELPQRPPQGDKIWRFQTSDLMTTVDIQTSCINVISNKYKSYNSPNAPERFRDMLQYAVEPFLKVISVPKILRIGLRYIDECPFPSHSTPEFLRFYNSSYPTDKFPIEETVAYDFATIISKGPHKIRYAESLGLLNGQTKFTLDFDGSSEMIPSEDWLSVTDTLHDLISSQYNSTINDPVREIMRTASKE